MHGKMIHACMPAAVSAVMCDCSHAAQGNSIHSLVLYGHHESLHSVPVRRELLPVYCAICHPAHAHTSACLGVCNNNSVPLGAMLCCESAPRSSLSLVTAFSLYLCDIHCWEATSCGSTGNAALAASLASMTQQPIDLYIC